MVRYHVSRPDAVWPVELYVDEEIAWRGWPDLSFRLTPTVMAIGIFAVALLLGCLGIATVVDRSVPGLFWTILGPGLVSAGGLVLATLLIDRFERGRTQYRITTHRVLIMKGHTVASYPFPPANQLRMSDAAPKTITLGHNRQNRPITLDRLPDADTAFETLRQLAPQDNAA